MARSLVEGGKLLVLGSAAVLAACASKPTVNHHWAAELIDGRKVTGDYYILVADERITAGKDGCNPWGYGDDGTITSTLVGCPPETERDREAYWAVVRSAVDLPAPSGDRLVLEEGGHVVTFRRAPVTLTGSP